jgi:exodeoxyribonuclease VII small subunit
MDAKSFNFEEAMKRLEEIVRLLENGQVSLDESIKLYEEGVALVNSANMLLSSAKQKLITVTGDIISNE